MKKIFNIKIIQDRKRHIIRMNSFYYLNKIFDDLHVIANKHIRITLFINEYDSFRLNKLNDKHIYLKNY